MQTTTLRAFTTQVAEQLDAHASRLRDLHSTGAVPAHHATIAGVAGDPVLSPGLRSAAGDAADSLKALRRIVASLDHPDNAARSSDRAPQALADARAAVRALGDHPGAGGVLVDVDPRILGAGTGGAPATPAVRQRDVFDTGERVPTEVSSRLRGEFEASLTAFSSPGGMPATGTYLRAVPIDTSPIMNRPSAFGVATDVSSSGRAYLDEIRTGKRATDTPSTAARTMTIDERIAAMRGARPG